MKSKTKLTKTHLSTRQAAISGGFDRAELYGLLRAGVIKSDRVGWNWLVDKASFAKYCKAHGRTLLETT